jgi:hypothetical protein
VITPDKWKIISTIVIDIVYLILNDRLATLASDVELMNHCLN